MLNTLRTIIQKVNTTHDLDAVLKIIVHEVKKAMGADVCSVYLFNQKLQKFTLMATDGLKSSAIGKIHLARGEGLVGLVSAREEPLILDNASKHPNYIYFAQTGEEQYDAFLGAPIIHRGIVVGVLIVQQKQQRSFAQSEEAFLVTICAQLAGVIAYAQATGAIYGTNKLVKHSFDTIFSGIAVTSGVGIGNAVVVQPYADLDSVPNKTITDIERELGLFANAVLMVKKDIKNLASKLASKINQQEQALFDVYLLMLEDDSLPLEINTIIKTGVWAQGAVREVISAHIMRFELMEDVYLRERGADVRDLGCRLLSYLQQQNRSNQTLPDNCVLITEELAPSMLGEIPEGKLRAIVSMLGSINSHASILTRAMGIPTVVCVHDLPYSSLDNVEIIVDGYSGEVIVKPSVQLRRQYVQVINDDRRLNQNLTALRDVPSETLDGKRIELMVNVGLFADVVKARNRGADGIGLYRTEVPFMINERFPSEAEQIRIYHEQLVAVHPHSVTMRTLDIGGDKTLPYFPINEVNPFLGWRGIRVTLDHPDIFLVQIKAMLKAAVGLDNLRILLPMVSNLNEVTEAKRLLNQAYLEVLDQGFAPNLPPLGVMLEVPSMVHQIDLLASMVDFVAVGSNDLTQYLLAVDRNNYRVSHLYDFLHPAVLHTLQTIVHGVHKHNKKVSICGEMAGNPEIAFLLLAMGFDCLSMDCANLLRVKWLLRQITLTKAQDILAHVMQFSDASEIRKYIQIQLKELGFERITNPSAKIKMANERFSKSLEKTAYVVAFSADNLPGVAKAIREKTARCKNSNCSR